MLVSEGVYALSVETPGPLRTINSYLLKDGNDSYLVDTNWPAHMSIDHLGSAPLKDSWSRLLELFDEAGADPRQLQGIIITHAHDDHLGYLPALQEFTGAPAMLHSKEIEAHGIRVKRDEIWRWDMITWFRQHGVPEDSAVKLVDYSPTFQAIPLGTVHSLSDGEIIKVGSMRWEVVWTPGHSPGHICLLERRSGIFLTGDHVLPHDTPNIHAHPRLPLNPLGSYIDSLKRVECLPVRKALPGHGVVMNDFQEVVSNLISHHDVRFADVVEALRSGPQNAYDVACALPWVGRRMRFMQLSYRDRWMALCETIAHLQALEGRGLVKIISCNGSITWNLIAA